MGSKPKNPEESSPEQLYGYGLRLLTSRDYTVASLARKFANHGAAVEAVEATVERLVSEGWLNDRRFARNFAEQAQRSGRYVGSRLRQELRRRGVPMELIREVMESLPCEQSEEEQICQLVARKYPHTDLPPASDRERRRMISFLQRRGFGMAAVYRVVAGGRYTEE